METVLVTGASSGIGLELAELFAKGGHDLVIVARREKLLESVASRFKENYGINVTVIPKDLTLKKSPQEIYSEVKELGIERTALFLVQDLSLAP